MVLRLCGVGMLGLLLILGSGCMRSGSQGASSAKPESDGVTAPAGGEAKPNAETTPAEAGAKTKEVMVAVTGMTWPIGWPPQVQKALGTLPWVRKVQVDFAKKQAVVTVETEKYDENTLINALEKAGFGGKVVAGQARGAEGAALGAQTRIPTAEEAKTYQLDKLVGRVQGQYVSSVEKGGPAEKAGLKAGDVVLALEANKVFSQDDLEDFLSVVQPGAEVKVVVKRAGTYKEETVTVALGAAKVDDKGKHFTWQYAGAGQLDAALAAAKKDRKLVLVGLSGADTWWPTTRFEGGPLSQILDDPIVVKASEKFVRLIIRRPHAYEFREKFKGQEVPIPGIIVLDADGKLVGSSSLDSAKEVADKLNDLGK